MSKFGYKPEGLNTAKRDQYIAHLRDNVPNALDTHSHLSGYMHALADVSVGLGLLEDSATRVLEGDVLHGAVQMLRYISTEVLGEGYATLYAIRCEYFPDAPEMPHPSEGEVR